MSATEILQPSSPQSTEQGAIYLETERLIIRRYQLSDAQALSDAANHPSLTFNLRNRLPYPYTVADAEAYLSSATKPNPNAYPLHGAILVKPGTPEDTSSEPILIGAIGVIPKNDVHYRTWTIGYWFTPPEWGKGFATEAVKAWTRWLFQTWPKLNRLEADAYSRNVGSVNVLKKCGFVEEGRKRGSVEKAGVVLDELEFGLLRSDIEMP